MTKTIRFSILFGIFALVLAAGALYAQHGNGGMMGMMSMMKDCPMMRAMRESPAAVLEHREALGLSGAQVQRLEELRDTSGGFHMQAMERMKALHQEIARASHGERFDEAAVRAAFDRMADLHTEMGVAMLRGRHEVRQILTPEQLTKLDQLRGGMMGMHGAMGGMMEHCPMMRGGMMGGHHDPSQEQGR